VPLGLVIGASAALLSYLIYIVFLLPLAMGFAGGRIVVDAIRIVKIRQQAQLLFVSLLVAITI
jgi:hypothetical protein